MRNFLELAAVQNIGLPTTNKRAAQLIGVQVTGTDDPESLAVLATVGVMSNGSGATTLTMVPFYSASQQIMIERETRYALMVQTPGEWSVTSTPVAGAQATATRAAQAGQAWVLRSLCASYANDAGVSAQYTVVVRDGASGVGAVLWAAVLSVPANDSKAIAVSGLNIMGSTNTAMTIEFTAAAGAGELQAVTMSGVIARVV